MCSKGVSRCTVAQCISLNKLCGKDFRETDKSFLFISTQEAVLRYDRTLSVHKQLRTSMSQRKKSLVLKYNRLSQISHKSSDPRAMRDAPWPFDLADLAQALLLPGHMGPAIVADWDTLLQKEGLAATTSDIRAVYASKLPPELTDHQRLTFKPVTDLTDKEVQLLSCIRGGSINPVVQYFEDRTAMFPSYASPLEPSQPRVDVPGVEARCTVDYPQPTMQLDQPMDGDCPIPDADVAEAHIEIDDLYLGALRSLSDSESESDFDGDDNDNGDEDASGCSGEPCAESCWCMGDPPLLTDSEDEEETENHCKPLTPYKQRKLEDPCLEDDVNEPWDDADLNSEPTPLSLVRDLPHGKRLPWLPTRLYKCMTTPSFYTWSPLKLPHITTSPHSSYQPPASVVYHQCVDSFRVKKTLRCLKQTSKLYAVGPMDFCGHAKAVRHGQGWVISLCHWDPTLPDKDQEYMMKCWQALGAWPKGFSKKSRKLVKKAVAFRAESKRLSARTWNADQDMTEMDIDREVSKRKRQQREAAHQRLLQKASDAAAKAAKRSKLKLKSKGSRGGVKRSRI
ncbi:hypothetical protein C8R45DRAFT_1165314 [Mycena sanguinolenta]|nr:hypothetical protein C8R45DRAFT_1165314 [Mycena sanguinolenta]